MLTRIMTDNILSGNSRFLGIPYNFYTCINNIDPFDSISRQEYWSGLLFPSPGDLPNPGVEPGSPALQADSLPIVAVWYCLLL